MNKQITVEAKPYEFKFNLDEVALFIIDMQTEFLYEGGFGSLLGNDMSVIRESIEPTKKILEFWREKGLFVLHAREGLRPDLTDLTETKYRRSERSGAALGSQGPMGRLLVRGEKGHDIIPELYPIFGEPIIDKPGNGAFYATDLELILRNKNIKSLIITGITTHVCVESTIREAKDRGYEVLLLEDCTSAFDRQDKENTLWNIQQQGAIFGWVSDSIKLMKAFDSNL